MIVMYVYNCAQLIPHCTSVHKDCLCGGATIQSKSEVRGMSVHAPLQLTS